MTEYMRRWGRKLSGKLLWHVVTRRLCRRQHCPRVTWPVKKPKQSG